MKKSQHKLQLLTCHSPSQERK